MHRSTLDHAWALVLAAGEGSRLSSLTRAPTGDRVPKQYCAFGGEVSLLQRTLDRAATLVAPPRIVTVVSRAHRRWWGPIFEDARAEQIVVQPENRGTAIGILLPLLAIARRDHAAVVVVLPTDHFVDDEPALRATIAAAFAAAGDDAVILLGITPESPEPSYGYIVPEGGDRGPMGVRRFVEKPPIAAARRLIAEGALWSSFLFVGRVCAYLELFRTALPGLVEELAACLDPAGDPRDDLDALYARTTCRDFSRDVLERGVARLRVLPVPRCGWVDLGEPERLLRTLPELQRRESRSGTHL